MTKEKLDELERELDGYLPGERARLWMKEVFELARLGLEPRWYIARNRRYITVTGDKTRCWGIWFPLAV